MDSELAGKLRWFSKNVDFLLEDFDFDEGRVDLYFDTFDVIEIICGMSYYYDGHDLELKELSVRREKSLCEIESWFMSHLQQETWTDQDANSSPVGISQLAK